MEREPLPAHPEPSRLKALQYSLIREWRTAVHLKVKGHSWGLIEPVEIGPTKAQDRRVNAPGLLKKTKVSRGGDKSPVVSGVPYFNPI